jgi:hypothetical protein
MVPSVEPGLVRSFSAEVAAVSSIEMDFEEAGVTVFARPKSRILACSRRVTKRFAGLMSRCTIPFS